MSNHALHSTKVPKHMLSAYREIISITDSFCQHHLNDEYRDLVRYATAALSRKRPSPLGKGQVTTWACAITYAIGVVNFLFDKKTKPFISASDLSQGFQVNQSTAKNKSRQVRELLKLNQLDYRWMLPSQLEDSTAAWLIMFDGFIVDVREMSYEIQKIAYEKGLIPYIYDDQSIKTRL